MKAISHLAEKNTIYFNEILSQNFITDIRRYFNNIDNEKACKTDGIKTFHNRVKSRLCNIMTE